MPIRINLLAEALAAEDERRRDPVKRAIWVVGFFIAVVLGFSGYLQTKVMAKQSVLNQLKSEMKRLDPDYKEVMENAKKYAEVQGKLTELERLKANRFLWANVLNELQSIDVPSVHLGRMRGAHEFTLVPGTPAKTNAMGLVQRAKPSKSQERIIMTLEARDFGNDNYKKFVEGIGASTFFKANLSRANSIEMKQMIQGATDVSDPGRLFNQITLECRFQEKELEEKAR